MADFEFLFITKKLKNYISLQIVYTSVCLADVPSEPSDFFPFSVNYQDSFRQQVGLGISQPFFHPSFNYFKVFTHF